MTTANRPQAGTTRSSATSPKVVYSGQIQRLLRRAKGLSTDDLGQLVGRSGCQIIRHEAGSHVPDVVVLARLAYALNVGVEDLFVPRTVDTSRRKLLARRNQQMAS